MKFMDKHLDLDLSGEYYEIIEINIQKQPTVVFCKKGVLRNLAKFTRKHLCQSLLFNKVAGRGF